MRVLLLAVSILALLAVGAALAVDRAAPDLVQEGLSRFGFADLAGFDAVRLDPSGDRVEVRGGRLVDPSSGLVVAQVDTLSIDLPRGWREGEPPIPVALRGRGGKAVLRWDEAGEDLTLVNVLVELVDRILALLPPGDVHHPLLPMTFEDLDLVVHAPHHPLERLSGVSVTIREEDAVVLVLIRPGPTQGEVELAFDHDGFRRFEARGMHATPTLLGIVPEVGWFLADGLSPHGVVDVEVTHKDELVVRGRVRGARFDSPYVPFPLGPADAGFEVVGDRLRVDEAEVGFEGGTVRVSMLGPIDDLDVRLDVAHAAFREELLGLVPAYERIERIRCHDGGTFELGLSLHADLTDPEAPLSLDGQGGFHIEDVDVVALGERPLHLTDVVGRFRVDDQGLQLPDVSARLARGSLRGSGDVSVVTGDYVARLRVEDVDIAEIHPSFHPGCECDHTVSGWLQAEADVVGTLGADGLPTSHGQASVRAGDLWDTPLVEAVLLAIPEIGEVRRDRQRVELRFSTLRERMSIEEVLIASDLLTLSGQDGSVDLDGNIRLRLSVFRLPLGAVGRVVEFITQQLLLEVQVEGTVGEPTVTPLPLPVVTGPLRSFFNGILGLFSGDDDPPDPPAR